MLNINDYDIDLLNLVDVENILEQLLLQIRTLTSSDGGTIYLKDGDSLRFCVFQNDSLSSTKLKRSIQESKFLRLPLNNRQFIAVESFLSSTGFRIDNIYEEEILDVSGIKSFDSKFGYKTHSMLTIPLVDTATKNSIGVLQIINKIKDKEPTAYDEFDMELIKMASSFMAYTISKTIGYNNSLKRIDKVINSAINDELDNKIENDRLNSFHHKIMHTSKVLKNIAHQWRQPLCELSINNSYLSLKSEDEQWNDLLSDNQSIIQSLSAIINDFETAYEYQDDKNFKIYDAYKTAYKVIKTSIKYNHIKITENIDKEIIIHGKKNIFIHVILSILQNSLDAFRVKKVEKPFIEVTFRKIDDEIVIIFEDNAGGMNEKLLLNIFEVNKDDKIKSDNMTLNMLKIVIRDKFNGEIFANNTELGFMIKMIIKTDLHTLEAENA